MSRLEPQMYEMIDYAVKHDTQIITTVEAFYKEPKLLYNFLLLAANKNIQVYLAAIDTTDKSWEEHK